MKVGEADSGYYDLFSHKSKGLARAAIRTSASKIDSAPFNSPTTSYAFDGVREGVLDALAATGTTFP